MSTKTSLSDVDILESVRAELPQVAKIACVSSHGASAWARTFRVEVELDDGSKPSYFLKVSTGFHGCESLKGEYESTSAIYSVVPEFTPKPLAWGTFKAVPDTHFYLAAFRELAEDLPEPAEFCAKLAQLHKKGVSPTGKFGFHVVTYNGNLPQDNSFQDSWEEFFANGLKHMLNINFVNGGPCDELEELMPDMFGKVIPRLLRPLETSENPIKPLLVHGDLWCGNAAFDLETDEPLVFDPCCFYAHNEYELGNWRPVRNKFSRSYFNSYQSHIPPSLPEADFDDRNVLYSIRFNLHAASLFPDVSSFRESVIEDMRRLIAKYPGGYEDFAKKRNELAVEANAVQVSLEDPIKYERSELVAETKAAPETPEFSTERVRNKIAVEANAAPETPEAPIEYERNKLAAETKAAAETPEVSIERERNELAVATNAAVQGIPDDFTEQEAASDGQIEPTAIAKEAIDTT